MFHLEDFDLYMRSLGSIIHYKKKLSKTTETVFCSPLFSEAMEKKCNHKNICLTHLGLYILLYSD